MRAGLLCWWVFCKLTPGFMLRWSPVLECCRLTGFWIDCTVLSCVVFLPSLAVPGHGSVLCVTHACCASLLVECMRMSSY